MSFLSSVYNFKLIFREVEKLTLKCVHLNNGINKIIYMSYTVMFKHNSLLKIFGILRVVSKQLRLWQSPGFQLPYIKITITIIPYSITTYLDHHYHITIINYHISGSPLPYYHNQLPYIWVTITILPYSITIYLDHHYHITIINYHISGAFEYELRNKLSIFIHTLSGGIGLCLACWGCTD